MLKEIDAIWENAKSSNCELFDGEILSIQSISESVAECVVMPYRFLYAQFKNESIKSRLNVKALAVTGCLHLNDELIIGRRSLKVSQYPGCLELVPSGSVPAPEQTTNQHVDFRGQLSIELEEEIGISGYSIKSIEPLFAINDEAGCVIDICCNISLRATTFDEIMKTFQRGEYSELLSFTQFNLTEMMSEQPELFVPTSIDIISQLNR